MWHCVEGYATWFFRVSHPYMTLEDEGHLPKSAHEELLENKQAEDNHAIDLLPICQRISQIRQEAWDDDVVHEDGSNAVAVVERMFAKAERATRYDRQRRARGVRIKHTQ